MAKINVELTVQTHKIMLPSTATAENPDDRVWLEVKDELGLSDKVGLSSGKTIGDQLVNGLSSFIVSWNYTEDGTENTPMIPITTELIDRLIIDPQDVKAVMQDYQKAVEKTTTKSAVSTEEKKTSLDTTPPSAEASKIQI